MVFLARRPHTKLPFYVWCKTQLSSCFAAGQLWVNFLSSLQKCNINIVKIINVQFWEKKLNKFWFWLLAALTFSLNSEFRSHNSDFFLSFSFEPRKRNEKANCCFLSYNSDVISHNSDVISLNSKITSHNSVFLSFSPTTEIKIVRVLSFWSDLFLVLLQSPDTCVFCVSVRFEFTQAVHFLVLV